MHRSIKVLFLLVLSLSTVPSRSAPKAGFETLWGQTQELKSQQQNHWVTLAITGGAVVMSTLISGAYLRMNNPGVSIGTAFGTGFFPSLFTGFVAAFGIFCSWAHTYEAESKVTREYVTEVQVQLETLCVQLQFLISQLPRTIRSALPARDLAVATLVEVVLRDLSHLADSVEGPTAGDWREFTKSPAGQLWLGHFRVVAEQLHTLAVHWNTTEALNPIPSLAPTLVSNLAQISEASECVSAILAAPVITEFLPPSTEFRAGEPPQ